MAQRQRLSQNGWYVTLLALAALLALGRTSRAAPHPDVVKLVVTGDPETTRSLEILVRELVANVPVELEWSVSPAIDPREVLARRPGDGRVLVRAWVDLSARERAKIYVSNGESERFIVRFVPEPNGYDAVAREALGQILESSIAAFVASENAGIPREDAVREVAHETSLPLEEPPPALPAPAPPAPPRKLTPRFDLGLAYQATLLDGEPLVQHGVTALFGYTAPGAGSVRLTSLVSLGYRAPASWEGDRIGVTLSGGGARLAVGVEADASRGIVLRGLVGGGLDLVFIEPTSGSPATRAAPSSHAVVPILTALGTVEVRISGPVSFLAGFGVDVDLSRPHYAVGHSEGRATVWTPWVVHPTALFGLLGRIGG